MPAPGALGPGIGSGSFCLQPSVDRSATNPRQATQYALIGKLLFLGPGAPLAIQLRNVSMAVRVKGSTR